MKLPNALLGQSSAHSRRVALDDWRIVPERLYPSCQDLLDMIPQLKALTLAKLANDGMVSTDTCNTMRKTRCLLREAIRMVAVEQGLREESINVMENDCWNHLHNVWFGAVIRIHDEYF
jgi:hypothetical protein